jgi:hypothetical protein
VKKYAKRWRETKKETIKKERKLGVNGLSESALNYKGGHYEV